MDKTFWTVFGLVAVGIIVMTAASLIQDQAPAQATSPFSEEQLSRLEQQINENESRLVDLIINLTNQ